MRVTIWGCRGSIPAPGPGTVNYGGNTSSIEVLLDNGAVLVLDAGTGIRDLGAALQERGTRRIHLLLTHLHLDHLEGTAVLRAPVRRASDDRRLGPTLAGAKPPRANSARVLAAALSDRPSRDPGPPGVPRRAQGAVDDRGRDPHLGSRHASRPDGGLPDRGGRRHPRVHPGSRARAHRRLRLEITRLDLRRVALGRRRPAPARRAVLRDEYAERIGWGHSSVDSAVAYANAVGARRLVLFHHDPGHEDRLLEQLEVEAASLTDERSEPPVLAREGMVLDLS